MLAMPLNISSFVSELSAGGFNSLVNMSTIKFNSYCNVIFHLYNKAYARREKYY